MRRPATTRTAAAEAARADANGVGVPPARAGDADPLGRARGQHATAGRTPRLAAAGDDEDGGSGGGTR